MNTIARQGTLYHSVARSAQVIALTLLGSSRDINCCMWCDCCGNTQYLCTSDNSRIGSVGSKM